MRQIQFITHQTEKYSYVESAKLALEGGCRWIQLRMKDATYDELAAAANEIQPLCKKYEAIFLIDDCVKLAKEIHADGVHLGKMDMPIAEARRILGEEYMIGGTANTFENVEDHFRHGADYIGCGPFRFTTTKKNLSPILGIEGYRRIIRQMQEARIHLPLVAIGGILCDDIPQLVEAGVSGIAVSGAILQAEDPAMEMKRMIEL